MRLKLGDRVIMRLKLGDRVRCRYSATSFGPVGVISRIYYTHKHTPVFDVSYFNEKGSLIGGTNGAREDELELVLNGLDLILELAP